jgi:peptidoglycan/xylan/chitin deacetylase (PgdA/CDA1 family)
MIFGVIGIFIVKPKQKAIITINSYQYDASSLINKAKDVLKKEGKEAKIISDINTTEKVLSLTFKGLSDTTTNQRILELLSDYDRKATFFIPGILAAEDTETVKNLHQNGHQIENNTLTEAEHLENYTENQLLDEFCRTNDIIEKIIGVKPNVLLGNSTNYTSTVRKVAYASGNEMVLESNHYISYQSFTSYEQVLDYVKGLNKGSILTIKLNGVLSEEEFGTSEEAIGTNEAVIGTSEAAIGTNEETNGSSEETDELSEEENQVSDDNSKIAETPAIDKKPTIENESEYEINSNMDERSEEERLIKIVEWLLQALLETKYSSVFVEDLPSYNDLDFTKDFADIKFKNNGKLAEVITRVNTGENLLSFSFRGIENMDKLKDLLAFLDENYIKATFFVTGNEVIDYPDQVNLILKHGHHLGNGGLTGKDLTVMNFTEVSFEIYKSDKIIGEKMGRNPEVFMPVFGKYNDTIREAASALDYKLVTYNKNPITDASQSIEEVMNYYKNGIKKGDIIYFHLDYYNDLIKVLEQTVRLINTNNYYLCSIRALIANRTIEVAHFENNSTTQNSINRNPNKNITTNISNGNASVDPETNVLENSKEMLRKTQIVNMRKENAGTLAKELTTIYTTEQALSYTFSGISQTEVLLDVLDKLEEINGKGTFFVTEQEVLNHADSIKKIALAGHEVQICLDISTTKDFISTCNSILNIREKVEELCGQTPTLVRYPYVINVEDEILEALSSTGCKIVWQDLALASSKVGKKGTFDEVLDYAYNDGNISARRGYIVFYRMDFYEDPSLIGRLMLDFLVNRVKTIEYQDSIVKNGSNYELKSLKQLLSSNKVYNYPVDVNDILPSVKNSIFEDHLKNLTNEVKFNYMQDRYIGNPDINSLIKLPGFTENEILQLNKTGTFTNDKVLFLTFDDWGSDKPINHILYVLSKYNIKASFFIRTNYIESNPNLVRSIAAAGHDIGSHTDNHLPFANTYGIQSEDDTSTVYTNLSDAEIKVRKDDLLISYNKLQSIVGDVEVDGISSLNKIFRPPTLAMSKSGMEAVFDMGFSHIVSGDSTIHDYEAKSSEELVDSIELSILNENTSYLKNGSILVFHMSDDSNVPNTTNDITAEALDIVIPKLLEEGYEFAKLSQYLSIED